MSYFFLWFFVVDSQNLYANEMNVSTVIWLGIKIYIIHTYWSNSVWVCVCVRTLRTHIKCSLSTHSPKNCILRQKLFESCAYFKHILMTTKMCILWAICGLLNWFRSEKSKNRWIFYRLTHWICMDFKQLPVFALKFTRNRYAATFPFSCGCLLPKIVNFEDRLQINYIFFHLRFAS